MVNFDNFGGLTSELKFHIFLIFNCEELVRICAICEGLLRFFSDVKNWYSIFTNVKNRYQFFTPVKNCYSSFTDMKNQYQMLTDVKIEPVLRRCEKKSFTNIDIDKNVTPPGGHIF